MRTPFLYPDGDVIDLFVEDRGSSSVSDEVEAWLREQRFAFTKQTQHSGHWGRSGRVWSVDYEIVTSAQRSMVFLLSTGTRAWARRLSEHVVAGCSDLRGLRRADPEVSFVSLFDDTTNVWGEDDFALVGSGARIATCSRPDEFANILTTQPESPAALVRA